MPAADGRKSLHRPRYRSIVALLKQIRREAGLSQVEVAEKLRRTRTFVTKCELGERRLDVLEWIDYCRVCGVAPGDFLARLSKKAGK